MKLFGLYCTKNFDVMDKPTDVRYAGNPKKVYNTKTKKWEDKPTVANIGKVVNTYITEVKSTTPIVRGVAITSLSIYRKSYTRSDMATINYKDYDDAIRSLRTPDYEVWKSIKKCVSGEAITVKLNITIVKDLTGIKDDSNAFKVIKRLVASGLIIKAEGYKDLYGVNPNIYFKGDYNRFAIDYINKNYNGSPDDVEVETSDWCDISNEVKDDECDC